MARKVERVALPMDNLGKTVYAANRPKIGDLFFIILLGNKNYIHRVELMEVGGLKIEEPKNHRHDICLDDIKTSGKKVGTKPSQPYHFAREHWRSFVGAKPGHGPPMFLAKQILSSMRLRPSPLPGYLFSQLS
jgi:hypothetical protein